MGAGQIGTHRTLLLLEFVTYFAMSCDAITVLVVLLVQVLPKAPVCMKNEYTPL